MFGIKTTKEETAKAVGVNANVMLIDEYIELQQKHLNLQDEYITLQKEYIALQEQHFEALRKVEIYEYE